VFYGTDAVHGYGYGQDEDQGQLGAWFVLAGMGLFDVQGGTRTNPEFQIASPLFESVTIQLNPRYHKGSRFQIAVQGDVVHDDYIQSIKLNGNPHLKYSLTSAEVSAGGKMEIVLGKEPPKRPQAQ
jgi:putative alpha-1,2-mannosidase